MPGLGDDGSSSGIGIMGKGSLDPCFANGSCSLEALAWSDGV